MNRTLFAMFALPGALLPLLFDSALKGLVLLAAAALCAFALGRASAATRHLVWLVAVVALLMLPVLAAALPQWRVLPRWTAGLLAGAGSPAAATRASRVEDATTLAVEPPMQSSHGDQTSSPAASRDGVATDGLRPAAQAPSIAPAAPRGSWRDWLPLAWAAGFIALVVRLLAAHFLLRRTARSCVLLVPRVNPEADAITTAFAAACEQLGIRQRVALLLDEKRTIPVVWGVFHPRLLLPAEARAWSEEQLLSVLLHELAHLRRRDPLVQWLTQIACALHWFNPLAWLAAWRLHAERERACDDLVLASGVRPSAYAEHLLHVATKLSPARWTAACGLAMARKSSLEGRLLAVLSEKLNRRDVTHALAAFALLLGAGIVIPLAMLRAAESDKPAAAATGPAEPKDQVSKALFENWKSGKRTDGRIPGGRIGEMAASLKAYMDLNAGTEAATKCEAVFKKCDATHDWTPAEAAALLDEIEVAAPSRAEWAMRAITERTIHPGKPLPDELAKAPWGQPAASGLRIAWLLEPREETQALDSVLKSRVLFHNTGKAPVCFATEDWIQVHGHKARDANGKDINVWAIERMGMRTRMIFRLAPGEYAEVAGHGLGVGSHETSSEKSIYKVGCWIEAKEDDTVIFTPGSVPVSFQTWIDNEGLKNSLTVWQEMIAGRVMREGPMPATAADREQLLRRVMQDFPGTAPTADEIAAFITDNFPDALAKLANTLQARSGAMHFTGELSGGETKFRVTKADREKDAPKQGAAAGAGTTKDDITKGTAASSGESLPVGTEAQLDWGEAVNGLRGAVVVRTPKAGAALGVYLAVQNVSAAALRFSDTIAAEEMRKLYVSAPAGRILFALTNGETTKTDALLQPREVVFLPIFPPGHENQEALMIEGLRKDSLQTWKVVLEIAKAPEGAWQGKLTTAETRGASSLEGPQPKTKEARALFKLWQANARLNGNIPGGLLSRLHDKVKEFIRNNTGDASGDPYAKKMAPLESRFAVAGDWKPADVVALFDEIAAVTSIPLETTMDFLGQHTLQHGQPLPAALENADWGEPLEGGLRMAFLLEPRAAEYHVGTEVKARILLHNSGKEPVAFITSNFHQPGHKAKLTSGADFKMDSTEWTTLGRPEAYRLAPGEFVEAYTPGLGIGARNKDHDDWSNVRAGSWILCGEGDDVVFTPGAVMLASNETPADPGWWLEFITERLMRETPVPQDTKEREYLLYRVVRDLFGTAPSTTEGDAFAADKSPDALKNLAVLLSKHPYGKRCHCSIHAGTTKFRVLPPDPDAGKRPRVASDPGHYTLGDIVRFSVTRRPAGERILNDGSLIYFPPGKDNVIHDLKLPDGDGTWAAGWAPASTVLWLSQKGLLRKIDFTNPAKVEETRYEGDKATGAPIPADIHEALRAALAVPDAPKQQQVPLNPKPTAPAATMPTQELQSPKPKDDANGKPQRPKLADAAYTKSGIPLEEFDAGSMKWGAEQKGLYVGIRVAADAEWRIGGEVKMELWACNPSGQEVKFSRNLRADIGLSVLAQDKDGRKHFADIARFDAYPVYIHLLLPPGHVVKLKEFVVKLGAMKNEKPEWGWVYLDLTPGDYQIHAKWSDPHPQIANEGEWTGEIESGAIKVKLVAAGAAEKPGANVTDPAYGTGPVTPLMFRAAAGDLASVQKLIDAGEDVNARTGDENAGGAVVGGITPLLIACRDGHFEVAQALLAAGATVDKAKSANGRFPLFEALAGAKDEAAAVKLMALLLDHSADPNERELHAGSTLHMAVLRDWKSAVRLLVARGANPAAVVSGFKTPATLAREKGLKEMADLLDELAKTPAAKLENPKAPDEQAKLDIDRDGAISLNRVVVTLEQLKMEAAKHPKRAVEVHAEKDVPYTKVVEAVDALRAAGALDFYFRAARVGDGKLRVANRTGEYDLGDGRKLYLCRPSGQRHWFTVIWPATGAWPRSRLSLYPNVRDEAPGQWAVVWEPDAEVLWWADGSDVGRMRVTDPTEVIVTHEGRENNFSRDFGLPDEVKEQFRRLGIVIGRDRTPGQEGLIGGNTGGQEILSAETQELWGIEGTVTDAKGQPLANVPVRVTSNREIATVKTNAQGKYRADFRLDFGTLSHWRAVTVEPMLETFTERDMAKTGEFNALLYGGEQPQRVRGNGERDFQPGPIPRFAERDIVPDAPGRADFVMLAAREITGEIVTADGKPAPPHWVVAATQEQRPGHNAAIQLSDREGHFRLKGIPANRPVVFTVNPDGKPDQTSKSGEENFAAAVPHQIRIILPTGGSGTGTLEVERAHPSDEK